MRKYQKMLSILLVLTTVFSFTACGNKNTPDNTNSTDVTDSKDSTASADDTISPEVVIIGTEGAYPPYNFIAKDGTVDGYDAAVARAVDELIPEIEFKFQPTAWDSIFVALESGNFDMIVSQIAKNEAREEKYQFAEIPYAYSVSSIIIKSDRTDIKSIEDLHGKTVAAGIGSNNTTWLEEYNKEHDNAINIEYYDGDVKLMLQDIISGRVDATVNDPVTVKLIADEQGLDVKTIIATELGINPVYFLYAKTDNGTKYKELIDTALQTLKDNGTLSKLSTQYLGADYTSEDAFNTTD